MITPPSSFPSVLYSIILTFPGAIACGRRMPMMCGRLRFVLGGTLVSDVVASLTVGSRSEVSCYRWTNALDDNDCYTVVGHVHTKMSIFFLLYCSHY